jgi:hypothetical protein
MSTGPVVNPLTQARETLLRLLDVYEQAQGISGDDYDASLRVHPMAEGKYLCAIRKLHDANLLNDFYFTTKSQVVIERLEQHNLAADPQHLACWGLGFAFREAPVDEPYVITSAIVAQGLLGLTHESGQQLAGRALAWLTDAAPRRTVKVNGQSLVVHQFSQHIPEVITNVAAVAAAVLHVAQREPDPTAVLQWLQSNYQEPVGWPYAQDNPCVDLVHQCYILNALADLSGIASIERVALNTVGWFRSEWGYLDRLTLVHHENIQEWAARTATECFVQLQDGNWLVRHAGTARDWSIGELLVLLSRLTSEGKHHALWRVLMRQVLDLAQRTVEEHLEAAQSTGELIRYRHSMHLAHGMAEALYALRHRNGAAVENNA